MAEESIPTVTFGGKPACLDSRKSLFQRIADAFGRIGKPKPIPTDPADDTKKLSDDYHNAVIDLHAEWGRRVAEVEKQGRKLEDAIKRRALPMIGGDSSPSTVLARDRFLNGMGASHRRVYRATDASIEALVDHAQLLRGLSVLVERGWA